MSSPAEKNPGWVLAFDLERTGPHSKDHRTVGLGLAVVDPTGKAVRMELIKGLLPDDVFEEHYQREFWDKHPQVKDLLKLTSAELKAIPYKGISVQEYLEVSMVISLLNAWADMEAGSHPYRIPLLSNAPGSDVAYFNQMLERTRAITKYSLPPTVQAGPGPYPLYRGVVDVDSYVEGVLDCHGDRTGKTQLDQLRNIVPPEKLGMIPPQFGHDHDPSHDAYAIAYLYQYARNVVQYLHKDDI